MKETIRHSDLLGNIFVVHYTIIITARLKYEGIILFWWMKKAQTGIDTTQSRGRLEFGNLRLIVVIR